MSTTIKASLYALFIIIIVPALINGGPDIAPKINDLVFSIPGNDVNTFSTHYYLGGASNSTLPLFLNGRPFNERSQNGYWGTFVHLEHGANTFIISQGSHSIKRTITRRTRQIRTKETNTIDPDSVFPVAREKRLQGETITLSCIAPKNAMVKVRLDNNTFVMAPETTEDPAIFKYQLTLPAPLPGHYKRDLGKPQYIMHLDSKEHSLTAPANIVVFSHTPFLLAETIVPFADLYETPCRTGGVMTNYYKGMTDIVTGMRGNYLRLSSGLWSREENFDLSIKKSHIPAELNDISLISNKNEYRIMFDTQNSGAIYIKFDAGVLNIHLSNFKVIKNLQKIIPAPLYLDQSGLICLNISIHDISGHYIEKTDKGFDLILRKPRKSDNKHSPLKGYVILLDPGHGGRDTGAIGLLGSEFTEKTINLNTALALRQKLQALGANVKMTRDTDIFVTLSDRLAYSMKVLPDLFISLHADHLGDTNDNSSASGFSVYYSSPLSERAARVIQNSVIGKLNRNDRGVKQRNFMVLRGTWTPSILIEIGFMANPHEYEWMMDEGSQEALVDILCSGIGSYLLDSFDSQGIN